MLSVKSPDYEFVAYIDESGDPSLKTVRPIDLKGGTEWLTISAILVRREYELETKNWVKTINRATAVESENIIKFTKLSPDMKLVAAETLATFPLRIFAVVTNKKNMRGYQNTRAETRGGTQWFYNWIVRILIERVTDYCLRYANQKNLSRRHIKFVFSQSGGHSYSQTAAYHALLKGQSRAGTPFLNKRAPKWQVMDWGLIEHYPHFQRAGLQLADVAASAFYHAVDHLDTGPCAPDYAIALHSRIAMDENCKRADYGVVLQPTPDWTADITEEQRAVFRHYGYKFKKRW
jgi:Protein of unknown function (DUF3800)